MEPFGSTPACRRAPRNVEMIFLSPEVYIGAKLCNTGEALREHSSEINNTLPIVPAAVKKRFKTLSKAVGLSWKKGRAGWLEDRPYSHPSLPPYMYPMLLDSFFFYGQLFPSP